MRSSSLDWVTIDDSGFRSLVSAILSRYRTLAPTVRDATVVVAEITSVDELPEGIALTQGPGSCRLGSLAEGDRRRFAWAVGPDSAKALNHPAERELFSATVGPEGFGLPSSSGGAGPQGGDVSRDDVPVAIIGLRSCDVAASGVLDRVLDCGRGALVVAVNCTDPGGTCFCASMGTGPALTGDEVEGADLVLWERDGDRGVEYLVTHASARGEELLAGADTTACDESDRVWAAQAEEKARSAMGRKLRTDGLPEALMDTLDSARWDDVAQRCLSCGNCTNVCPTCFCSSTHDSSSPDGSVVTRTQRWDSCFALDHSYVHGGSVRTGTSDRYRQWLTHKLSTWWAQFGESGCVGCGRCITWCPVGIDLVEEANALMAEADAQAPEAAVPFPEPADPAVRGPAMSEREPASATEVFLRRRATHDRGVARG